MEIVASSTPGSPIPVAILVWKDRTHFGAPSDPSTAETVLQPSTSDLIYSIKKNAIMFRKFYISIQGDKRVLSLKIPRRLRIMKTGDILKITVSNLEPATNGIEWFMYGKIITQPG